VFFVGLLQPLGAIMPLAAAQSEWVCDYLAGRYALPAAAAMRADIEDERERDVQALRRLQAPHDAGRLRRLPRRRWPRSAGAAPSARAGQRGPAPLRGPRPVERSQARHERRRRPGAASARRRPTAPRSSRGARDVFAEDGYDAAAVRDIIRRTDLASGTFYNYFPDKARSSARSSSRPATRRAGACGPRGAGPHAREFVEGRLRGVLRVHRRGPGAFAFLRRNAGTIAGVLRRRACSRRAPTSSREDLRAAIAAGAAGGRRRLLRARDDRRRARARDAPVERDPPDVEGATRFATELFLGGMARVAAKPR
jgi:AcrR family transcriptional regulator